MASVITEGLKTAEFLASEAAGYRSREQAMLASGQIYEPGAILGRSVLGTAAAVAGGGNTGDGAMGAITVGGEAQIGVYSLTITEAASNAGAFEVKDPAGDIVGTGNVAAAFDGGGLSFTLADGAADFVVGDSFAITVTETTQAYTEWDPDNTDGSEVAVAINYAKVDATSAAARATIIARDAEVNGNLLTYFTSADAANKAAAAADLARVGIIVR